MVSTVEEYLEYERNSDVRHEYYRGRIIAMAGGSPNHSQLGATVGALLWNAVRHKPCRVFSSDVRLAAEASSHYTYPDLSVVCGDVGSLDSRRDTLTNPILIVEILSPTTERADRGRKFADYQNLASLREYVLVSQFEPRIEIYRRQPGKPWAYDASQGLDASITLESIDADLRLAEVYEKIEFEPEAS